MFKKKMIEAYEKCYIYSQAIPMKQLTKNPIMLKFGKHMKFHKCNAVRTKKLMF